MRRAERLKRRKDFANVYSRGRPYRSRLLTVRTLETAGARSRFGFAVSQAVGNAVVRNKVKRRLREIVRSLPVDVGWDVVLNARRSAAEAKFEELRSEVEALFRRAGILRQEEQPAQ